MRVSLLVSVGLVKVAVGWLLWGSWMVTIVLLRLGLKSVAVEWQV